MGPVVRSEDRLAGEAAATKPPIANVTAPLEQVAHHQLRQVAVHGAALDAIRVLHKPRLLINHRHRVPNGREDGGLREVTQPQPVL